VGIEGSKSGGESPNETWKVPKVQARVCAWIQGPESASRSPCGNPRSHKCSWESLRECRVLGMGARIHAWSKGPGIACENLQGSRRVLELLATVCVGVEKSQNWRQESMQRSIQQPWLQASITASNLSYVYGSVNKSLHGIHEVHASHESMWESRNTCEAGVESLESGGIFF